MGAFASVYLVPDNEAVAPKHTHPSQPNWITVHAVASELSIAETERLWLRFQQLGCTKDGEISDSMMNAMPVYNDAFSRNIMKNLINPKTKKITFENFLRGLKWCETATVKEKLQGIYRMLNTGKPVPKTIFVKILERIYTNPQDKKDLDRVANAFYKSMDSENKGQFNEEQFVQGILSNIPEETLEELLRFEILPNYMKERLHQNLPEFGSVGGTPAPNTNQEVVSTRQLQQVAEMIYRKDWERTANKLDLTREDVTEIKAVESDKKQQAFQMLSVWKRREGDHAYTSTLERALKDSGMREAASILL